MIRELTTLLAVAREGTFAAAGRSVNLTQAAVSAQMQRLERELGFPIFDRTGRSARLNAAGLDVLARAEELVELYRSIRSGGSVERHVGRVSLGAIASVQRAVLAETLAGFHAQQPGCKVRVVPGVSLALLNMVDAGDLDLAAIIRPPFPLQGDLRWTTLSVEPFRLLVPGDARGGDWRRLLLAHPFVRYDRTSFGGRSVDRFLRAQRIEVQDVCEVDELDAIVRMVAQGTGVALVPQTLEQTRWPAGVRAIDLGPHTFHREIGLLHRTNRGQSAPARELARLLIDAYRRPPALRSRRRASTGRQARGA